MRHEDLKRLALLIERVLSDLTPDERFEVLVGFLRESAGLPLDTASEASVHVEVPDGAPEAEPTEHTARRVGAGDAMIKSAVRSSRFGA